LCGAAEIGTVIAEGEEYQHGALCNHPDFGSMREQIIALYDSLTVN